MHAIIREKRGTTVRVDVEWKGKTLATFEHTPHAGEQDTTVAEHVLEREGYRSACGETFVWQTSEVNMFELSTRVAIK